MTLNRVKLGRAVTFMKYLARVVSLTFLPKTSIWNKTHVSSIKFAKFCRTGENEFMMSNLQKNLPIFLFLSNLSLLIIKKLRAL